MENGGATPFTTEEPASKLRRGPLAFWRSDGRGCANSRKKCASVGNPCVVENSTGHYSRTVKAILTPIDFSDVSEAVVSEAATLARALGGRVVLLTVIQPPVITNEYAPLMENIAEITAAGEKAAAKRLAAIQDKLEAEKLPVEVIQLNGAPVPQIADQAKKLDADYIVMGSHGHTAFYDLLVGSTTHGVLLRATCPVVIVPAQTKKSASRT